MECIKESEKKCVLIMATTDKVYKNKEWIHQYRENDELGGLDPYSSSKTAMEFAIKTWRESFFQELSTKNKVYIATVRSGNVIGGGDKARDRIIPDAINAIKMKRILKVRSPESVRPWQHVLDPLNGYSN